MVELPNIFDFYNYSFMELGVGASPNNKLYEFYHKLAKKQTCQSIIEIGYGTGKLTKILLDSQLKVVAIDKSTKSKEFLEKKCNASIQSGDLLIHNCDILEFDSAEKFDLIIAVDEFISHFLSEFEINRFLNKINNLLTNNGAFITDIRLDYDSDFNHVTQYPLFTFVENINGVKYINCSSWKILTDDKIIFIHYKFEELDESGTIIKSYIRILKHGKISFDVLKRSAIKNNLSLHIKTQNNLNCIILKFIKKI
ncbi:hypothetical protein SDC9_46149 [bioreactor metagenome]|uniref:Methyltransferase domain-containing protein n=1 Tax=bioreactor metagenome TaxID=1076179 RepID=A0A644W8S9_9ZZZZ